RRPGHGGGTTDARPARRIGRGRQPGTGRPDWPRHRDRGPVPEGGGGAWAAVLAVPLSRHDHQPAAHLDAPGVREGRPGGKGETAVKEREAFLKALSENEDDALTRSVY